MCAAFPNLYRIAASKGAMVADFGWFQERLGVGTQSLGGFSTTGKNPSSVRGHVNVEGQYFGDFYSKSLLQHFGRHPIHFSSY